MNTTYLIRIIYSFFKNSDFIHNCHKWHLNWPTNKGENCHRDSFQQMHNNFKGVFALTEQIHVTKLPMYTMCQRFNNKFNLKYHSSYSQSSARQK